MHGLRRGCVPPRTASSAADPLPAREPHGEEEHCAGPARHRTPHCPVAWPARPPHNGGLAPRAPRCGAPNKGRAPLGYFPAALPRPAPLTRVRKAGGEGGVRGALHEASEGRRAAAARRAETQAALAARLPGRRARGHDYLFELTLDSPARLVGPEVQGWSHLHHTRRGCSGADRGPAGFPGNTRLSGRLTVLKPLKPPSMPLPVLAAFEARLPSASEAAQLRGSLASQGWARAARP